MADKTKSRTAAHVGRTSHGTGGGHRAPNMHPSAVKGANAARGAIRTALHTIRFDPHDVGHHEPEDPMSHPLYQGLKFPEYEYREFPKWVHPDGELNERSRVANNEAEEAELLASGKIVREADERARLLKVAEVKGVQVDKRWGVDRLAGAITEAGFDAKLDPFK